MKNHSGKNFLVRRNNNMTRVKRAASALLTLAMLLLLSGCATTTTSSGTDREVDARVREPAKEDSEGVQVFPLQNPAVKELLADAGAAESSGDFGQAATLLERALRIQPRDPEILQGLAEVQLQMKDYKQALYFATRSYDMGPRVGEICSRNWRTISVCREHLGEHAESVKAEEKASACMKTKPRRL